MSRAAPLSERIVGALRLAPMTVGELSRCLGVTYRGAWRAVAWLRTSGAVCAAGVRVSRRSRPVTAWCLAPACAGGTRA